MAIAKRPPKFVRGMRMSLSSLILNIFLFDTPIGVYSYKEILFIHDVNSGIEVTESFKYPQDIIKLEGKQ